MTYEINKELVLSTAHMPEWLTKEFDEYETEEGSLLEISFDPLPYGYRVYTGYDTFDYPKELIAPIKLALSLGCKWLVFDSDGPVVEGLQQWEW